MQNFGVKFDSDSQNKCIRLARVSTLRQEKNGHSKDIIQNSKLSEYESQLELKLYTAPFEFTESAAYKPEKNRDKFNEMMLFVKKNSGKFRHIVVYKVSRWTRNSGDEALAEELSMKFGYILHFVSEGIVLDKDKPDYYNQLSQFNDAANKAKKDINDLRAYNQDDRELCIKEGIRIGPAPFGYKWEGRSKNRRLIIVEEESKVVKYIFELYTTGIYGYSAIFKKVNEKFPFVNLHRSKIGKILSDPFYIGQCETTYIGKKVTYTHRHPLMNLSPLVFKRANEIRSSANKKTSRNAGKMSWNAIYRGVMECAYCEGRISPDRKKDDKYHYYICKSKKKDNHPRRVHALEENINEYVECQLAKISYPKEFIEPLLEKINQRSNEIIKNSKETKERLHSEIIKNSNGLKSIYYDYKVEQSITQEMYLETKKLIEEKLKSLQVAYDALPSMDEDSVLYVEQAFQLLNIAPKLFSISNSEEKQLLLKTVFSKFVLDNGKPVFTYQSPFDKLVNLRKCPTILVY